MYNFKIQYPCAKQQPCSRRASGIIYVLAANRLDLLDMVDLVDLVDFLIILLGLFFVVVSNFSRPVLLLPMR